MREPFDKYRFSSLKQSVPLWHQFVTDDAYDLTKLTTFHKDFDKSADTTKAAIERLNQKRLFTAHVLGHLSLGKPTKCEITKDLTGEASSVATNAKRALALNRAVPLLKKPDKDAAAGLLANMEKLGITLPESIMKVIRGQM